MENTKEHRNASIPDATRILTLSISSFERKEAPALRHVTWTSRDIFLVTQKRQRATLWPFATTVNEQSGKQTNLIASFGALEVVESYHYIAIG